MLEHYKNLSDALDPSLETLDALVAMSFELHRQTRVVQQEYWCLMRDMDGAFGLDMMCAARELEELRV